MDLGSLFGSRFLLGLAPNGQAAEHMYRILPPTAEIKAGGATSRTRVRADRNSSKTLESCGEQSRQGLFSRNFTRLLSDPKFENVTRLGEENGQITLDTGKKIP